MILSSSAYEKMKSIVQIVLPATATLYFTLSAIWALPAPEQVVGTIAAITTFLGVVLGISNKNYNKPENKYDGIVKYTEGKGGKLSYVLELNGDPADLKNTDEILFKVQEKDPANA